MNSSLFTPARWVLLCVCLLVSACSSTVVPQRFYPPPSRPGAQVARLWTLEAARFTLTKVDGQPVVRKGNAHFLIEVLPGRHTVSAVAKGQAVTAIWNAEAGKEYCPNVRFDKLPEAVNASLPAKERNRYYKGTFFIEPEKLKRVLKVDER